jgi:hypothetical protein
MTQIANFQFYITAIDHGEQRPARTGGVLASKEASKALSAAEDTLQATLKAHGFQVARSQYGVTGDNV